MSARARHRPWFRDPVDFDARCAAIAAERERERTVERPEQVDFLPLEATAFSDFVETLVRLQRQGARVILRAESSSVAKGS